MIRRLTIYSHFALDAFAHVAAKLAQGFIELGLDVDVIHIKDPPRYVEFPKSARLVQLAPRALLSVAPVVRYLRSNHPDVVISLGMMQNAPSVLARILSHYEGVLLLSEHSALSYTALVEQRNDLRFRMMPAFARRFYPRADGLTAVSEDVLRDLVEQVGISPARLPMRVIHNPIDAASIRRAATEPVDHPWFRQKREPVVLNVARLAKEKNQRLLLEAVARMRTQRGIRLVILGEGPLRPDLLGTVRELGLEDCVDMPGHVENPFPYFARSDAFVLSSDQEGFGLVLGEAMASRCPVITTACQGGPRQLLQEGRCGILTPPGDADALVSALKRVFDDPSHRTALVEAGSRRAEEFAPAKIAGQWLAFAEELLEGNGTSK